jgi:DNA (cytosine-5)-methyltransferase 1
MIMFGSVCSGIEAASVAWTPLGWKAAWLSEIEPFPCAVLQHHYPDVPNLGDMTKIAHLIRDGFVPAPDVFCGGTPCQAFSIAGLRNSLDDARGNLSLTFCEIANEIDTRRAATGFLPSVIFWENVPGVLSTKDNAFGCFLGALAGEDSALEPPGGKWQNAGCVFGPQRAVAWRVLDAQYFGVAQRRRRVFVVASAREGFDPTEVLFEFDGVRRDSPPRRETGQETAGTIASRTDGGGFPGTDEACSGYIQPVGGFQRSGVTAFGGNNQSGPIDVATARNACSSGSGRLDFETETFLVQPIAFSSKDYGGDAEVDLSPTLRAGNHHGSHANAGVPPAISYAIQAGALRTNPASGPDGIGVQAEHAYTLEARSEVQAICITGDITHTLKAEGFDASEDGTGRGQPIVAAFQSSQSGVRLSDTHATLDANNGPRRHNGALIGMAVRRLTPVECERLQGFPDGYTDIRPKGKDTKDGPRYKALGNSWAVPNVHWIGARIDAALRLRGTV